MLCHIVDFYCYSLIIYDHCLNYISMLAVVVLTKKKIIKDEQFLNALNKQQY